MIIHPDSARQLTSLKRDFPQAILLTGTRGVGLGTIARELAGTSLVAWQQPHTKKGEVDPSGSIFVEDIRNLYDQLKTGAKTQQIAVLDDADRMTHGAQNAFLKLLEEPTRGTHFILTSHMPERLLATVRSRVQTSAIVPVTPEQSAELLDTLTVDATRRTQISFIAEGLPAEMQRLAADEAYFATQADLARKARDFLMGSSYQQLKIAHGYQSDRSGALALIDMTCALARRSLAAHPQVQLVRRLDSLLEAREAIVANGNPRLHLARAVV